MLARAPPNQAVAADFVPLSGTLAFTVCARHEAAEPQTVRAHWIATGTMTQASTGGVPEPIVDVDDRATWPAPVAETVARWASDYGGVTTYPSDLPLPLEADSTLSELLSGCVLRAYHCTRLLDHEVQMIRERGLRVLTAELIRDRIISAQRASAITKRDAAMLSNANVFATGEASGRENQVCFVLSTLLFQVDPGACTLLLTTWGGEAMYMSSRRDAMPLQLSQLGKPTIVVSLLQPFLVTAVWPHLSKVFVAAALGLAERWADAFYGAAVPPSNIEAILQPGDTVYDEFGPLPID